MILLLHGRRHEPYLLDGIVPNCIAAKFFGHASAEKKRMSLARRQATAHCVKIVSVGVLHARRDLQLRKGMQVQGACPCSICGVTHLRYLPRMQVNAGD